MTQELFWMLLTVAMTALFWIPYILDRIATRGLMATLGYPDANTPPQSPWAERMMKAHDNAVENLVIFVPLVFAVQATGVHSDMTAGACALYFFARLGHVIVYVFRIPVIRTLFFALGWLAQVILFFAVIWP